MAFRLCALGLNALAFGAAARMLSPLEMGIWALATTLTSVVMSLDLGLSSHLRNQLSDDEAPHQTLYLRALHTAVVVSAAWASLGLIGAGAAWAWRPGAGLLTLCLCAAGAVLLLRLPFYLSVNAFYSFHEPAWPIVWEFVCFAAGCVLLALVWWTGGGVLAAVVAYLAGGLLSAVGATVQLARRRGWRLWPQAWQPDRRLLVAAWPFAVLQLVGLGLASLPGFTVGALARIEDVTAARAAMVLCQTVLSLHLAHAMPIWTELSRLRQAPDPHALAQLRRRLRREAAALVVVFLVLALLAPPIIRLWLGRDPGPAGLAWGFCVWGLGCGVANLYSLVLNGGNRPLATASALLPGIAVALGASWFLSGPWGSPGVAAGFGIGAAVSASLMVWAAQRLMADMDRQ